MMWLILAVYLFLVVAHTGALLCLAADPPL